MMGDKLVYEHRKGCLEHAALLVRTLDCLRKAKPTPMVFDMDIAVGVYQCLRVLFCLCHLIFAGLNVEDLQTHAQSCLRFVQSFSPTCKALTYIVGLLYLLREV